MTDINSPDSFGGGAHRRKPAPFPMPEQVRPVPTHTADERDPSVMSDSDRVVEHLKSTMDRAVAATNKSSDQPKTAITTPLKEIAQRIKKLVHDDGEQMGDELKAKITDTISLAKALQLWADDTLKV
jgi:hypothetical protein